MRLKEPLYGIRVAQLMSLAHLTLAIMMVFVERRAILDANAVTANDVAHHPTADAHAAAPAAHLIIPEGETSFLGLGEKTQMTS
jgi:hypothetical protein